MTLDILTKPEAYMTRSLAFLTKPEAYMTRSL